MGRSEEDDKRPRRKDGQEQCENSAVVKKSPLNTKNTLSLSLSVCLPHPSSRPRLSRSSLFLHLPTPSQLLPSLPLSSGDGDGDGGRRVHLRSSRSAKCVAFHRDRGRRRVRRRQTKGDSDERRDDATTTKSGRATVNFSEETHVSAVITVTYSLPDLGRVINSGRAHPLLSTS